MKHINTNEMRYLHVFYVQNMSFAVVGFTDEDTVEIVCAGWLVHGNQRKFLSDIGGYGLGDTVRRMMKVVGSYSLWSEFSYKGRKGKKPFCATTCSKVILRSCLTEKKEKTIKDVEKEIQEF
ncbi:uncharacterized protein LOC144745896 [Ciona intestinalis]